MNGTMEQLTIETEITRALREQLTEHPRESGRLVQRLAQLRADRDPAHQAVIELRIKVRAGLAKASELDRALAALDQIDGEIRSLENESEDYCRERRDGAIFTWCFRMNGNSCERMEVGQRA